MATVANLNVLVKANASPFRKALKSARASAKRFGKSMARIGKQVAKFGALVATGAVAGLTVLTKQAFTAIDAMGKLSGNIGITTEALAGFQLAGELAGVSTESMDKALKKMVRSVGQAGQGLSTQVRAFKSLGLSFEDLAAQTPEEQFLAIADGMQNLGTASERAAASADIFGRAGVELINILGGGADALRAAQAEADAFGLSVTGIETKQIEAANDAFLKVRRALTGIGRQIAVVVAPFVELLSKRFTEAAAAGEGIREKIGGALKTVSSIIGGVLDGIDVLKIAWLGMQGLVLKGLEIISRRTEMTVDAMINLLNKVLPDSLQLEKIGVSFADGFAAGIEDIDAKVQEILLGPSGKERVSKFFGLVTAESKKAAEVSLAAQKSAFDTSGLLQGVDEKKQKASEKRLTIGFRSEAFAAALASRGGGAATAQTPESKRIDKTNELLKEIQQTLQRTSIGLA